jgi:uncharacterized protein YoxC
MNLNEEIQLLEEKIESYKQEIKSLNQSVLDVNSINNGSVNFNIVAHSIMFLNKKIKSAESLLNNYYKYKTL